MAFVNVGAGQASIARSKRRLGEPLARPACTTCSDSQRPQALRRWASAWDLFGKGPYSLSGGRREAEFLTDSRTHAQDL